MYGFLSRIFEYINQKLKKINFKKKITNKARKIYFVGKVLSTTKY